MSLILKGIDMPTNGETLIVGIYGDGNVSIEYSKPLVLAIEPNAQAIQIPKDHGRIIDSEEILTPIYCIPKTIGLTDKAQMHLTDMIENAPTILEAET